MTRRDMLKVFGWAVPITVLPKEMLYGFSFINGPRVQEFYDDLGVFRKVNFNLSWRVLEGDPRGAESSNFEDSKWKEVTLPYAWNEDSAFKEDIDDLPTGVAWYRKRFRLPESFKGKKIFFECEGIRQAGEFYVNGQYIGRSENGVMAFGFDLTEAVHFGDMENVIAARIDNSWDYRAKESDSPFQWNDRNFYANYGGINKNTYLHITDKLYQTLPLYSNLETKGVYIYADKIDIGKRSAVIHAESEVKNEIGASQEVQLEVVVIDASGEEIKRFRGGKEEIVADEVKLLSAFSEVEGLNFWSWGYGYLYDVETRLKVNNKIIDKVKTRTGFRKTAFKDGMIYLNDRVIQIHGYAQRTTNEWPAIGNSVPAWLSDYSNGLMVESNANLVRWMHVTPWKQDVESCDRVGLMQAMSAGDSEGDVKGERWEQRKSVMRDAIIYNRNNPSIVFYECGNHGISEAHMKEMKEIRDGYDPTGGRAIGSREMLDSSIAEYGGEMLYINKSDDIPFWSMEYSRDEGLRKYWDDFTPPFHKNGHGVPYKKESPDSYNHNMQSHAIENVERWYEYWKARPGMGKRVNSGGVNIIFSDSNTHHRGEVNYRVSGSTDAMRIKKQSFFAHKVIWDSWVDVESQDIHIIGHWNYYLGVTKDVYVVSTAEEVALECNGKSLGWGERSSRFLFKFEGIEWQPGRLKARGYDERGKQTCEVELKTIGKPTGIRLKKVKSPIGFKADGHDLALEEVEVTDEKGDRCPIALNMIEFDLEGPGEWRGGIAKGPANFILQKALPVEGGVNRVFIRSTTTPGIIHLKAKSEGLQGDTLTLETKPFESEGGLAKLLPSAGLPSVLERGQTPSSPSYEMKRKSIKIIDARAGAGANKGKVTHSYDDNERTSWKNDGKLSTAWIEYRLESEAEISEIDLKLNQFRTKTYPLIITVDNIVVFKGETETNLGYYTVQCEPTRGKRIKIQLSDPSSEDDTNIGEEVSGRKLAAGIEESEDTEGTLNIIEAEIYEIENVKM